jgi:ribosomal protein S18 acetylase RimI-like enzyme
MREIITEQLAYSKAFIFVMDNFVEILKKGYSELSLCISNEMNVTYMIDEDIVMGACVYEMDDRKKQAYIYTAAVDKFYRNEGVYTIIYKEVERVCRMNGMKVLNSNIHVNNTAMIEHALRNDRELLWFRTRKVL